MDTLYDLYSHFCCKLALETCFSINSFGVHNSGCTHSLVSLQWSGLSNQLTLLLTENCVAIIIVLEMEPLQMQRSSFNYSSAFNCFSTLICSSAFVRAPFLALYSACWYYKERNVPASAGQGLFTASQDSCHT